MTFDRSKKFVFPQSINWQIIGKFVHFLICEMTNLCLQKTWFCTQYELRILVPYDLMKTVSFKVSVSSAKMNIHLDSAITAKFINNKFSVM